MISANFIAIALPLPSCSGSCSFKDLGQLGSAWNWTGFAELRKNSIRLRSMMVAQWVIAACFYSLASREIICDSVEYMVNRSFCADALVCIFQLRQNYRLECWWAALRLNILWVLCSVDRWKPVKTKLQERMSTWSGLIAMVQAADIMSVDEDVAQVRNAVPCPNLWFLLRDVYRYSMNCLTESI